MVTISGSLVTLTVVLFGIVIGSIPILMDLTKDNWRRRFREQIRASLLNGEVEYIDLQHIAERWNQDRKSVLLSLRIMHSEALSAEDESLKEKIDTVRKILAEHQEHEPYAELPENISIQLARLKNDSSGMETQISQIAASLSDLYSGNQRSLSRQKKLSYVSATIGVVGILLAIPGLYITFTS